MRALLLLALVHLALPLAPVQAQASNGLMDGIRNGGGWVSIPIANGKGSVSTVTIPTFGLTLTGCVRVWDGHSGIWEIHARDNIGARSLEARSSPGQGVPFSHTFGVRSQLEVDFTWSEPRDTTLFLWIGIERADEERDACTPVS